MRKGNAMETNAVSRRSFLGLGAAAVAAGAGVIAAPRAASADIVGDTTGYVPDFMNPPAAVDESTVTETVECEVCVVGIGLAGVCALREAAEQGAKVVGIEKGPDVGYRSGEFGTFGSEIHKQLGIE